MSLLQQIALINTLLSQNTFTDTVFAQAQLYGIATDAPRGDTEQQPAYYPVVTALNGEGADVTINDSIPLQLYHRVLSKTYAIKKTAVGDRQNTWVEKTEVKMVVAGNTVLLSQSAFDLEALIAKTFPTITASQAHALGLLRIQLLLQRTVFDTMQVFREEYKGITPFLTAAQILFAMYYTMEAEYCPTH